MNNTTERGKRGRTPPEDDGARKRQKVGEDGPATGKDGERTETNSTAAGPSQRRLPHRDPQSDRGRFPSIYIRSVPRTAPGIEPLKARYDLQRLHQRLELAEDEKNRFRPRSLAALVEYLTPAQLSPTSVSPLRRLGQGYTASEYVSLRTAERLRLNALDPMRTLVLVAHAPPDDAAFLPLERLGCDLHSPTTDFLVPLAHAVTSLYKMTVRMVDFEEYAPDRRVMQARQEEDQGDLWTTQATDEEQSAYFATLRALVAATPGEVSLVACGGVAMGALNLDHFGPDTKRQVGLTSPNIASAAAIPHPASVMRLTLRHDRTEAVIASLAQIHELLPTRAYRLGALAGEQISLRRLYERFVEGQRVYKVPERRRVSSYEELPQSGQPFKQMLRDSTAQIPAAVPGVQTWMHKPCGARILLATALTARRFPNSAEVAKGMDFDPGDRLTIAPEQCPYCELDMPVGDLAPTTGEGRLIDVETSKSITLRQAYPYAHDERTAVYSGEEQDEEGGDT